MIHLLKAWPRFFEDVRSGSKRFEIRKNDRDFRVGDRLLLVELEPETQRLTGREIEAVVTYILTDTRFVKDGFCAMSFEVVMEIGC